MGVALKKTGEEREHRSAVEANWPDLLEVVEERVKPQRMALRDNASSKSRKEKWWIYSRPTPDLYDAIRGFERVMVIAQTSNTLAFAIREPAVFAHSLVVFARNDWQFFASLQSRPHLAWVETFSSKMKDDTRYIPSDCFETFPRPEPFDFVKEAGKEFYEFRSNLMIENDEGLTKTYNRFHDPHEQSEGILELRRLHGLMDGAVLRAYGWDDLAADARCEFLLDYEEDDDDEPGAKKSKKKKPWHLRWPDEFRDEVLAKLLELNEQRHKEELLSGSGKKRITSSGEKKSGVAGTAKNRSQSAQTEMEL